MTGVPSDSRVPEDVLREHSVGVDDDGVILLRRVEAAVQQRDEVFRDVAVASLTTLRLLPFLVVA